MKRRTLFIIFFIGILTFTYFEEVRIRPFLLKSNTSTYYLADSLPKFLAVVILTFGTMAIYAIKEDGEILKLSITYMCSVILYEFFQIIMPERTFDVKDIIASIMGGVSSYIVLILINKLFLNSDLL